MSTGGVWARMSALTLTGMHAHSSGEKAGPTSLQLVGKCWMKLLEGLGGRAGEKRKEFKKADLSKQKTCHGSLFSVMVAGKVVQGRGRISQSQGQGTSLECGRPRFKFLFCVIQGFDLTSQGMGCMGWLPAKASHNCTAKWLSHSHNEQARKALPQC